MAARVFLKGLVLPFAKAVFWAALFLRVWWTSDFYHPPWPVPACSVQLFGQLLQACADDRGVHLLVEHSYGRKWLDFDLERRGVSGYRHGYGLNILGLQVAVLPMAFVDHDSFVSAYAVLVLPYWLLIGGAGFFWLQRTSIPAALRPYCRLSPRSRVAGGVVCVLFLLLNMLPWATWLASANRPRSGWEYWTLIFETRKARPAIKFIYGFPFTYLEQGYIHGSYSPHFNGDRVGWSPHLAGEDICLAALTAFFAVLLTEWLSRKSNMQQTGPPGAM